MLNIDIAKKALITQGLIYTTIIILWMWNFSPSQNRTEIALKLHWNCTELKLHWNCNEVIWWVLVILWFSKAINMNIMCLYFRDLGSVNNLWKCWVKFHSSWKRALKLHWNCTEIAHWNCTLRLWSDYFFRTSETHWFQWVSLEPNPNPLMVPVSLTGFSENFQWDCHPLFFAPQPHWNPTLTPLFLITKYRHS